MDKDREQALVRSCQQGDRQALDTLVRHYEKPVFNAAFRILGNTDEASDVTQTAFLKVFENLDRYDPKHRLFSWLYRIALNEAIDQIRRRNRLEPLADERCAGNESPERVTAEAERARRVQAVLMELSVDYRTVIVMHYFTECSYRDIAGILDLPEKTVKSRLFTARQQMKEKLAALGITNP